MAFSIKMTSKFLIKIIFRNNGAWPIETQPTFVLTARQYGEVVLPDAASGQSPDTLAAKLSRCKEGMARVFAVMVQILLRVGAIAVEAF
jgi:hypothetical protein